jgi:hypothetical protein
MDMNDTMVTITKKEYEALLRDSEWMRCLEAAGVDNWVGYDHAIDIHDERYGDDTED